MVTRLLTLFVFPKTAVMTWNVGVLYYYFFMEKIDAFNDTRCTFVLYSLFP